MSVIFQLQERSLLLDILVCYICVSCIRSVLPLYLHFFQHFIFADKIHVKLKMRMKLIKFEQLSE